MNAGSFLAWLSLKGFLVVASLLPFPVLSAVFRALAAAFRVLGVRRRVVRENLRAALGGETGDAERSRIERDCHAEYARIVSEIVVSDRLLRRKEERFEALGLHFLSEAGRGGKGLLILTGDIGNLIVMATTCGLSGSR